MQKAPGILVGYRAHSTCCWCWQAWNNFGLYENKYRSISHNSLCCPPLSSHLATHRAASWNYFPLPQTRHVLSCCWAFERASLPPSHALSSSLSKSYSSYTSDVTFETFSPLFSPTSRELIAPSSGFYWTGSYQHHHSSYYLWVLILFQALF